MRNPTGFVMQRGGFRGNFPSLIRKEDEVHNAPAPTRPVHANETRKACEAMGDSEGGIGWQQGGSGWGKASHQRRRIKKSRGRRRRQRSRMGADESKGAEVRGVQGLAGRGCVRWPRESRSEQGRRRERRKRGSVVGRCSVKNRRRGARWREARGRRSGANRERVRDRCRQGRKRREGGRSGCGRESREDDVGV